MPRVGWMCGGYGPTILDGWIRSNPTTAYDLPAWSSYALIAIIEGSLLIDDPDGGVRPIGPQGIVLAHPDRPLIRRIPPRARWSCIRFVPHNDGLTIVETPGREPFPCTYQQPAAGSQPSDESTWGVRLALEPPAECRPRFYQSAMHISDLWWRGNGERLHANALLAMLLAEWVLEVEHADGHEPRQAPDPLVAQAERFIRQRLPLPVTVDEVARHLGMHRSHFTERYTDHCRRGPGEFIRLERLRIAKAALAQGDSVKQAAEAAGFASMNAMIRIFRAVHGMTPAQWMRALPSRTP